MTSPQMPPARVLLVEDDEQLRVLLGRVLGQAGYAVSEARDGREALERLGREAFDLLVLDVRMPRMGGLEVLAELERLGRPARAIVMTGDSTPESVLGAIRAHACRYLRKPFTPAELLEQVRRALALPASASLYEVVSATPRWVELTLPCRRDAAERIHDFLMHLESGLPEDVRDAVGHAFRELLLNAIEWGGQLDPEKRVRVSCVRTERLLLYRIADPGRGFRLEDLPHAAISSQGEDLLRHAQVREEMGLRPGGFGILLAQAVVDELIYNEARNEVVFLKYLR